VTPEALQLVLAAKADEILSEAPAFQGVLVIGSSSTNTETMMHGFCRGNRHAAIAAAEEWLAAAKAYDQAYHAEQGRYDAVVHRQNQRP
jgi:fructose-specific component phosphotransferase system IIB-like protein